MIKTYYNLLLLCSNLRWLNYLWQNEAIDNNYSDNINYLDLFMNFSKLKLFWDIYNLNNIIFQ